MRGAITSASSIRLHGVVLSQSTGTTLPLLFRCKEKLMIYSKFNDVVSIENLYNGKLDAEMVYE